jgi:hypothetical protein
MYAVCNIEQKDKKKKNQNKKTWWMAKVVGTVLLLYYYYVWDIYIYIYWDLGTYTYFARVNYHVIIARVYNTQTDGHARMYVYIIYIILYNGVVEDNNDMHKKKIIGASSFVHIKRS